MISVIIDGELIFERGDLHDAFSAQLMLPEWYGRNLDALHDCLTDICEPVNIVIKNKEALSANLGVYAEHLLKMLRHTERENERIKVVFSEREERNLPLGQNTGTDGETENRREMKLGLKRGTVELAPYDARWEENARETILRLKEILKDDVIDIQHIGSTAVKHISAKPIIDIVVGVRSFEDLLKYNDQLRENGFVYRGQDVENQLLYVMGDFENDTRTHHIHVVIWNGDEWINYINFRDYINENATAAEEYLRLKEELASKNQGDRKKYTQGKQQMIDKLLEQAKAWRKIGENPD